MRLLNENRAISLPEKPFSFPCAEHYFRRRMDTSSAGRSLNNISQLADLNLDHIAAPGRVPPNRRGIHAACLGAWNR